MSDGITVILSTYNRASVLRETLESFCELDLTGLDVEFVVVDNNSTDRTGEIVKSFDGRLPSRYLIETRAGKNCALNRALDTISLREVVVFTDDDITPDRTWLRSIARSCERWPRCSVFGGRVIPDWTDGQSASPGLPYWIRSLLFGEHHHGESDREYPPESVPVGGNMWVRKGVFATGLRYNEAVGPRPKDRIMGSETTFLVLLARSGHRSVYVPEAVVHHRLEPKSRSFGAVRRRGFRWGRSLPHINGPWRRELYKSSRVRWEMTALARCLFFLGKAMCSSMIKPRRWTEECVSLCGILGETLESRAQLRAQLNRKTSIEPRHRVVNDNG